MEFSQPVLIIEKENCLFPHKLRSLDQTDFENFRNHDSIFTWVNSFLVPIENKPYDLSNFEKIQQNNSPHLGVTMDFFNLVEGLDTEKVKSMYGFLKSLFYYAPQSDAIGYRQKHYEDESGLILYYPSLVEVNSKASKTPGLISMDQKKFNFQVSFYIPKNTRKKTVPRNLEQFCNL